jgi:hypothetical protein
MKRIAREVGYEVAMDMYRSKVEVVEDITTCFPYRGTAVLLLTLLSIRYWIAEGCTG